MNRIASFALALAGVVTVAVAITSAFAADRPAKRRAAAFDPEAVLQDYAGDTILAFSVHGPGANGVVSGPNVALLRSGVVEHVGAAQAIAFAAWPHAGGTWPAEKPSTLNAIQFDTRTLDAIVEWARSEDLVVAHHLIFGPNFYMPDWFASAGYTAEELDRLLRLAITATLTSNDNASKVRSWNLVNEVFATDNSGSYRPDGEGQWDCRWVAMGTEPDRSGLTGSARVNAEHPVFIRKAFKYAAEHTQGKLELRDFNVEFSQQPVIDEGGATRLEPNRKLLALYQLVRHLQNSGVPIGAVGLQAHLNYSSDNFYQTYDFADLAAVIRRFKRLGVEVYITELDVGLHWDECDEVDGVRVPNAKANWDALRAEQAKTYYQAVRAAREAGADMIATWGFVDGTMENWRKGQEALLLDPRGERKPAYQAVLRALYDTLPD